MKKIFTLVAATLMVAVVWAQTPEKLSYQAVVRDAGDALVTSQAVGMRISILENSPAGAAVYVETQIATTNDNGLVSLEIGSGNVVSGNFADIDWGGDTYFIKTETDPAGGTAYSITGTSQFMSVPYALHAKTVENVNVPGNNTISIPAFALSKSSTSTIITEDGVGLRWKQDHANPASIYIKKPANYTGGDVEFSILFRTLSNNAAGVVHFFIRPRSYNHGDDITDSPSISSATGVSVVANTLARVYEEKITIPASRLTEDWWKVSMQRKGSQSTYTDDVIVLSVALSY